MTNSNNISIEQWLDFFDNNHFDGNNTNSSIVLIGVNN